MLHLFHPALVHVSVAFLVLGGLCETYGIVRRNPTIARFGEVLVPLGTLSLLPTVVTGFLAANSLTVPPAAEGLLELHERVGLTVLGLFIVLALWKAWDGGEIRESHRHAYALTLLGGVALVAYGAFLGGLMVYREGVGVGVGVLD